MGSAPSKKRPVEILCQWLGRRDIRVDTTVGRPIYWAIAVRNYRGVPAKHLTTAFLSLIKIDPPSPHTYQFLCAFLRMFKQCARKRARAESEPDTVLVCKVLSTLPALSTLYPMLIAQTPADQVAEFALINYLIDDLFVQAADAIELGDEARAELDALIAQ